MGTKFARDAVRASAAEFIDVLIHSGQLRSDCVVCPSCGKEQGVQVRVIDGVRSFYKCKGCGNFETYIPSKSAIND